MSRKSYIIVTAVFFLIVAFLHLLRLIIGWEITMEGWSVPRWLNFIAFVVTGYLAYEGFRLSRR
jgi:hypothetical protein